LDLSLSLSLSLSKNCFGNGCLCLCVSSPTHAFAFAFLPQWKAKAWWWWWWSTTGDHHSLIVCLIDKTWSSIVPLKSHIIRDDQVSEDPQVSKLTQWWFSSAATSPAILHYYDIYMMGFQRRRRRRRRRSRPWRNWKVIFDFVFSLITDTQPTQPTRKQGQDQVVLWIIEIQHKCSCK
jgi:hypothetical protein